MKPTPLQTDPITREVRCVVPAGTHWHPASVLVTQLAPKRDPRSVEIAFGGQVRVFTPAEARELSVLVGQAASGQLQTADG